VPSVIPLRRGDALSVTTRRYQSAGGHFIDQEGIQPDVPVELPAEVAQRLPALDGSVDPADLQLQRAVQVLKEQLERAAKAGRAGQSAALGWARAAA